MISAQGVPEGSAPLSEDAERLRAQLAATPRVSAAALATSLRIDDVALGHALLQLLELGVLSCNPRWGLAPRPGEPRRYWLVAEDVSQ